MPRYNMTTKAPKRLSKEQRKLLRLLISDINDETIRSLEECEERGAPDWLLDWTIWSAGENLPGCLPETPYYLFTTEREARGYCRELDSSICARGDYVSDYMPVTIREVLPTR